ncbi:PREDICTED: elicitor-responsive protein 3-like [Camelina sativa]|uniref:Elicitor-responsive protein 3-like n=1 Tax=Camelina sativa TaxID=90675 RepID=A0ABM0URF0_CAMSA|nr:PREDICTED: elicitor-responsive protein 3-like [Camelina sativa]
MSTMAGIQGQVLEVTVVGCQKLKDTEWFSRQDPYVVLEYSGSRHRTRTCTDGGKNAVFQEKFMFTLLEGLRDLKVAVWNSNTLSTDNFIGNATIQLQKVLSQGYDDCTWTLQTKTGRFAGEVRLILHYAGAKKHNYGSALSSSAICLSSSVNLGLPSGSFSLPASSTILYLPSFSIPSSTIILPTRSIPRTIPTSVLKAPAFRIKLFMNV